MRANNLAQVSTSTGTGNFTLGAAWNNCETLNSFFGLNHYFEYMIRNDNGEYEKGVGYLSNSTTLVRMFVIDTNAHTPVAINFSAGNKVVMCSTDVGNGTVPYARTDSPIVSLHSTGATAATIALAANRPRLCPFWLHRPVQCTAIGLRVTTLAATSTIRIAVYQMTTNGSTYTFNLLDDVGEVDSTTTGEKNLTYTRKLGAGTYFMAAISAQTPTIQAYPTTSAEVGLTLNAGTATANSFDYGSTLAGSAAAAPTTMSIANPSAATTSPRIHLKGTYL